MRNQESKMKDLAEVLMTELLPIKGYSGVERFLLMNGYSGETLADMGFSESFLFSVGVTVKKKNPQKAAHDVSAISIRDRVIDLIPSLRDSRTHSSAMEEISGLAGDLNEFCFDGNMELTYSAVRNVFDTYIVENGIVEKAEAEGCHPMEYIGLSVSEAYSIMGEDAA